MEAKGCGCCIARYSGGNPCSASQIDHNMLRFRPIAPKPATDDAATHSSDYVPAAVGGSRTKRRTVRDRKRCRKQRRAGGGSIPSAASPLVTLPLLSEAPELKGSSSWNPSLPEMAAMQMPMWVPQVVSAPEAVRPAWSCVTVERVVELCREGTWGPATGEEEMRMGMEAEEACPGFVTDARNCVTWVNEAFRRMVRGKRQEGGGVGMMVALVTKERLPAAGVMAFTCRVRVQYTCGIGDREKNSVTTPCDVWRMEGGGSAWRLDVKAALSLGR